MEDQSPEERYLARLSEAAGCDHPIQTTLRCSDNRSQRAICHFGTGEVRSKGDDQGSFGKFLADTEAFEDGGKKVYIIENIGAEWMGVLGVALDLDGTIFLEHAENHGGMPLEDAVMGNERNRIHNELRLLKNNHIDGVLSNLMQFDEPRGGSRHIARRVEYYMEFGWQSTSRISYERVTKDTYLFLVDSPRTSARSRGGGHQRGTPSKLSLRVPYALNPGGLPIPQLYSMDAFEPMEILRSFFGLPGAVRLVFNYRKDHHVEAIDPIVFSQFIAARTWRTNIDHIDNELKRIAFEDLRRPDVSTNDRLHDLRQDLNTLQAEAFSGKKYLQHNGRWVEEFGEVYANFMSWPADTLEGVVAQAARTERFLMDTFQLLMSSISILDAQSGIQNAKRGALLAQLATIYVPLSFVTGIWGMNVKEINDSPRPLWMFGVTLVVALAATIAVLWALRNWRAVRDGIQAMSWRHSGADEVDDFTEKGANKIHRDASKMV